MQQLTLFSSSLPLLLQVDMHEQKVYLIMELCQGGELFDRIAECGGLDEADARRYFVQILSVRCARALVLCYARGFCIRVLSGPTGVDSCLIASLSGWVSMRPARDDTLCRFCRCACIGTHGKAGERRQGGRGVGLGGATSLRSAGREFCFRGLDEANTRRHFEQILSVHRRGAIETIEYVEEVGRGEIGRKSGSTSNAMASPSAGV
jgi:hypothetical protein